MFDCINFGEVCYRTTIEEPRSVAFQVTHEQVRFIDHRSTENMNNHDAVGPCWVAGEAGMHNSQIACVDRLWNSFKNGLIKICLKPLRQHYSLIFMFQFQTDPNTIYMFYIMDLWSMRAITIVMVYAWLVDSNHVNSSYGHFPVAKIEAMKLNSRLILFEATDRELLNISTRMTCTKCMIFIYVMKMLPRCSEKETKRGPVLCH